MPNTAAFTPNGVSVEIPNITNPMCATDENAIRRFMSVCAKQPNAP